MSLEGLVLSIILAALTVAVIVAPLLKGVRKQGDETLLRQRDQLQRYYDQAIANIRDLDEDLAAGKVGVEAHAEAREMWVQRGLALLKAMDDLDGSAPHSAAAPIATDHDPIEQAIARAKQAQAQA